MIFGNCVKGLRKVTIMSVEIAGRYLDPASLEYEAGVLSARMTISARVFMMSKEM
jgi:hypothetical protein